MGESKCVIICHFPLIHPPHPVFVAARFEFTNTKHQTPINIISSDTTQHTSKLSNQIKHKTKSSSFSWFPTKFTFFALHFAFSDIHAQTHQKRVLCFCSIITPVLPSAPHQPPFALHSLTIHFPPQNQTRHIIVFFYYLKKHKQNYNIPFIFNYSWIIIGYCFVTVGLQSSRGTVRVGGGAQTKVSTFYFYFIYLSIVGNKNKSLIYR